MACRTSRRRKRMLGHRQARQTATRSNVLVSRRRRRSLVFRLDRQHGKASRKRRNRTAIGAAQEKLCMVGTQQRALPSIGKIRTYDGFRTKRFARHVCVRLCHRPADFARITVGSRRMESFFELSAFISPRPNRYDSNQKQTARTLQPPSSKVDRQHPTRDPVRRMER